MSSNYCSHCVGFTLWKKQKYVWKGFVDASSLRLERCSLPRPRSCLTTPVLPHISEWYQQLLTQQPPDRGPRRHILCSDLSPAADRPSLHPTSTQLPSGSPVVKLPSSLPSGTTLPILHAPSSFCIFILLPRCIHTVRLLNTVPDGTCCVDTGVLLNRAWSCSSITFSWKLWQPTKHITDKIALWMNRWCLLWKPYGVSEEKNKWLAFTH